MIARPDPSEHHEYYGAYIDLVPDADIVETLRTSITETAALLRDVPKEKAGYRYAPGKWTVKDVLAHLIDSERTFGFRAFWFARGGPGELGGFDQDEFVQQAFADDRSLGDLLKEFEAVRASSVALYESLDLSVTTRTGVASGFRFSVRAFPYLTAGHEIHHRNQLRELYGLG